MKRLFFVGAILASNCLLSQTFSDNFDSYIAGQKLASQSGGKWTTWSNAPGGAEDGLISDIRAKSLPNSVYFESTAQAGGPVDQVKNFGVLNTGNFTMNMNFFVESGKAAYFNLQRNATIGDVWALSVNFNDDGTLIVDDGATQHILTTYEQNKWFNFKLDINFNLNRWEVFIDESSVGVFASKQNQIASIDIYPVDQNTPYDSEFYMDDFEYTITPYVLPTLNAGATYLSYDGGSLAGVQISPKVTLRNLGVSVINSLDVTFNYDGIDLMQSYSGLNLASLAETELVLTQNITLSPGQKILKATLSNVNGAGADGDNNDNTIQMLINPTIPAFARVVVGEEGTGTWCQWCPRGAVFMDLMKNRYDKYWAGAAVHNGDTMTVVDYDAAIGGLISGYPSALVDRGPSGDPSGMEARFLTEVVKPAVAKLDNESVWDAITRTLTVTVRSTFLSAANDTYKLACIITEDSVTGTSADFNQSNAYAGGANGVMGGFELLPSTVPAALMVYHHVARIITPSFDGQVVYPAIVNAGDVIDYVFTINIAPEWDETKINVVSVIFNPDGTINNGGTADFTKSIAATSTNVSVSCGSAINQSETTDGNKAPDVMTGVTFSTDCPSGLVTISQNPPVGAPLSVGANTIYVSATDECGNSQYCTTVVNLLDNSAATIDCGVSSVTMTNSIDGNKVPSFVAGVTASTTCGLGGQMLSQNPAAGSKLKVGANTVIVTVTDDCGNSSSCTKTINFIDDLAVSITELNHNDLIQLFPNPATTVLNFSTNNNIEITQLMIYTADGKLVYQNTANQLNGSISVAGYSKGIYTVKFTTKKGEVGTIKFTKE